MSSAKCSVLIILINSVIAILAQKALIRIQTPIEKLNNVNLVSLLDLHSKISAGRVSLKTPTIRIGSRIAYLVDLINDILNEGLSDSDDPDVEKSVKVRLTNLANENNNVNIEMYDITSGNASLANDFHDVIDIERDNAFLGDNGHILYSTPKVRAGGHKMDEMIANANLIRNGVNDAIKFLDAPVKNKSRGYKLDDLIAPNRKDVLKQSADSPETIDARRRSRRRKLKKPRRNLEEDDNDPHYNEDDYFWEPPEQTRRIYQGTPVRITDFPFVASIHVFQTLQCAGAIIKSDLVLTAASCLQIAWNNRFFRENPRFLSVRVGSTRFFGGGEEIGAAEVYFHPHYKPKTLRSNLAIIRLMRNLRFSNSTKRYCVKIHYDREDHKMPANAPPVTLVGFGAVRPANKLHHKGFGKLQYAILPIYPFYDCRNMYTREFVTNENFCAGLMAQGSGACNHDVGDPAVSNGAIVGVVSFGSPICGRPDTPTVFTKVGFYKRWIDQVVKIEANVYAHRMTTTPISVALVPPDQDYDDDETISQKPTTRKTKRVREKEMALVNLGNDGSDMSEAETIKPFKIKPMTKKVDMSEFFPPEKPSSALDLVKKKLRLGGTAAQRLFTDLMRDMVVTPPNVVNQGGASSPGSLRGRSSLLPTLASIPNKAVQIPVMASELRDGQLKYSTTKSIHNFQSDNCDESDFEGTGPHAQQCSAAALVAAAAAADVAAAAATDVDADSKATTKLETAKTISSSIDPKTGASPSAASEAITPVPPRTAGDTSGEAVSAWDRSQPNEPHQPLQAYQLPHPQQPSHPIQPLLPQQPLKLTNANSEALDDENKVSSLIETIFAQNAPAENHQGFASDRDRERYGSNIDKQKMKDIDKSIISMLYITDKEDNNAKQEESDGDYIIPRGEGLALPEDIGFENPGGVQVKANNNLPVEEKSDFHFRAFEGEPLSSPPSIERDKSPFVMMLEDSIEKDLIQDLAPRRFRAPVYSSGENK